jgi:hypothetical protein
MRTHTLIAVFASEAEAIRAKAALVRAGIDENSLAISTDLTRDGIAAEAPGQAYENQGSMPAAGLRRLLKSGFKTDVDADSAEARVIAAVERGSVVLTAGPLRHSDVGAVAGILKKHSAVAITER